MTLLIIALVWLLCGTLSSGLMTAYFNERFPTLPRNRHNPGMLVMCLVTGPMGLAGTLLSLLSFASRDDVKNPFRFGLKWR